MLTMVEGIYRNGKVELDEAPVFAGERRVRVMFLEDASSNGNDNTVLGQQIWYGMFAGPIETKDEDFQTAEFHGDPDDGLDWTSF